MKYSGDTLPKTGRTKHQREAAARQLARIPEELRPAVRECLEAVWQQEDREIRHYQNDLQARRTITARVPRQLADRITAAAADQGQSVYAWALAAFTAKLAEDERPPWT